MRRTAAAIAALALATTLAPQARAALVAPSLEWVSGPSYGSCQVLPGGSVFGVTGIIYNPLPPDVASFRNVLTVPGVGTVVDFVTTYGSNMAAPQLADIGIGPFLPYSVPPGTPLTITTTSHAAPGAQGAPTYISTMVWNCTTGAPLSIVNQAPPPRAVPTLGAAWMALVAALLLLSGVRAVRTLERRGTRRS